jgi:L-methionine (R)-S-oxide reductase
VSAEKKRQYAELAAQLSALIEGEPYPIANAANMAALIYHGLPELNWAGFYFADGQDQLVLGPFQGKPACVRIAWGQGVCGTAAARRQTIVVPDVHEFPGHIACDPDSRSELVVPLLQGERVLGVIDLDSPLRGRFDDADRIGCERLVAILSAHHRDWRDGSGWVDARNPATASG